MLVALAGLYLLVGHVPFAVAATPTSGQVGPYQRSRSWQGHHYAAAATIGGACPTAAQDPENRLCDHYVLTVGVDASFWVGRSGGARVTISWASSEDRFGLRVIDSTGNLVAASTYGTNSQEVFIPSAAGTYEVHVIPHLVTASGYQGRAVFAADCPRPSRAYDSGGTAGTGYPNDPLYPRQWGLRQVDAPGAWTQGARGRGATIAIIDTGVDLRHPDLKHKISGGADLGQGGPGQPDDCPGGPQDEDGHGTHVAGVAAAATDNGIGVAGVAPLAKLMPMRIDVEAEENEVWAQVALAVRMAAEQGADVINLSVARAAPFGQIEPPPYVEEAVAYAWSIGAVVVGAAGNDSFPLCDPPASFTHVVCAAATDRRGLPSFYSNFPNDPEGTVALRAPGGALGAGCEEDEDIWSTVLEGGIWDATCTPELSANLIRGYGTGAGTSYAAPHVAGVAALLAGRGLTNEQIVACLRTTSSNRGRFDPVMGYGIVNAAAAVRECS